MNRHHFYSKKNKNDADSSKGLSVRTLEDQCSIVNSICLVSKIASAVNKKVQPYRSITLECTGLIWREVPDGRRSRGTYTALTMQHTGILSTCVSRHRASCSLQVGVQTSSAIARRQSYAPLLSHTPADIHVSLAPQSPSSKCWCECSLRKTYYYVLSSLYHFVDDCRFLWCDFWSCVYCAALISKHDTWFLQRRWHCLR